MSPIEHATHQRRPANTAWLVAGAVAVVLAIAVARPSPIVFVTLVSLTLVGLWLRDFALVVRAARDHRTHRLW